jgi:hypothetical protein
VGGGLRWAEVGRGGRCACWCVGGGRSPEHRKNITGHIKVIQKRSMRTIDL